MTTAVLDLSGPLADIISRGEDAADIQEQAQAIGGCEQPIRLQGRLDLVDRMTGELELVWSTEELPDGVTHKRCNNRRASRCQPCSRIYQQDAWQLVLSGLAGGKGVPESVACHPTLFVTLTAPSFGPVHTRTVDACGQVRPCRARRDQTDEVCEHGRPATCSKRHGKHDPQLGRPLCPDCWDYAGAVLWNVHASELWRRTRIRIYRELAALTGQSERRLKEQVSIQYIKVAEYQKRGLVHFHALVRLDAARPPAVDRLGVPWRLPYSYSPAPAVFSVELLAEAIRRAVLHVTVPYPESILDLSTSDQVHDAEASDRRKVEAGQRPKACPQGKCEAPLTRAPTIRLEAGDRGTRSLTQPKPFAPPKSRNVPAHRRLPAVNLAPRIRCARWGTQLELRTVQTEERAKVAGYLAKYATKHTEAAGGLDRPVKAEDLATLPVDAHAHRLIVAAWLLALHAPELRTDRWAHQLGYGGHFLTKSRQYSTTFTALRHAREVWQHWQRLPTSWDPWTLIHASARRELRSNWALAGIGWRLEGDALLARTVRRKQRARHQAAREAKRELAEILALAG